MDRTKLVMLLSECSAGTFDMIVFGCKPPAGVLSGREAPQSTRAVELLTWAEGENGIGLDVVYDYYCVAMGIEKGPSEEVGKPDKDAFREQVGEAREQVGETLKRITKKLSEQREIREAISNEPLLVRVRQHLKDAQGFVDDAYKPFARYTSYDESAKPGREKFIDAIDLLKAAGQSIQSLRELLYSDSSLPDGLRENRDNINYHIDTVVEEIKKRLLLSLSKNKIGDFSRLQTALQKIAKFLP